MPAPAIGTLVTSAEKIRVIRPAQRMVSLVLEPRPRDQDEHDGEDDPACSELRPERRTRLTRYKEEQ